MHIDLLIRSRRKTVALIVQPDGQVVVRAPLRLNLRQIQAFVNEKEAWIRKKQAQFQRAAALAPFKKYITGEKFWYLGQEYPLELVSQAKPLLHFDSKFYLSQVAQPQAEQVFTAWYRRQARVVLTERVRYYATLHGLRYQKIRISSARTRWGSCSSRGTLSFTWRLVMAPPEVIDYVVVHELAHTVEHHHSKIFWAKVAEILPGYKPCRQWLRKNGGRLKV